MKKYVRSDFVKVLFPIGIWKSISHGISLAPEVPAVRRLLSIVIEPTKGLDGTPLMPKGTPLPTLFDIREIEYFIGLACARGATLSRTSTAESAAIIRTMFID